MKQRQIDTTVSHCPVTTHLLQILTCEGEGTSMLQLRCFRVCLGVCLQDWWLLLVPGTGSGDARCAEKLDDEAVVEVFSCSAMARTKISNSADATDQQTTNTGTQTSVP